METWMITLSGLIITFVAGYAGMRSTVNKTEELNNKQADKIEILEKFMNEKKPVLGHYSKVEEAYGKKLDYHAKELVELKTRLNQSPTMREVRDEFVSKEIYLQMGKHIDEKFAGLQSGVSEILKELKDK